jgi:hypothetical protein
MIKAEHKKRHLELHKNLDELFADFVRHTNKTSSSKIETLLEWSYNQTINPTEDKP